MMSTHEFNRSRCFGEHKLGKQTRAAESRLDTSFFCPRYDKRCSSSRVTTISYLATSATGVTADTQHTTMPQTTTARLEHTHSNTPTSMSFVHCTNLCTLYNGIVVGGISA